MTLFPEIKEEIAKINSKDRKYLNSIRKKSKPFRPSNGDMGMIFESNFCGTCNRTEKCKTLLDLNAGITKDVIEYKGIIFCLRHTDFKIDYIKNLDKE